MKQTLLKLLNEFGKKRILVLGDIMLDKYIWGDVSRISPEAPVQVVNVIKETFEAGGASNVANNISALGAKVFMVGITGNDDARDVLLEDMNKKGISTDGVFVDKDKPTTQKVRVIGKSQQLLRVDYESKEHLHEDIEKSILKFIHKSINSVDVIIVSDYAKGVITEKICTELIKISRELGKQVIVDPKPRHRDFYKGVTLITPNNAEAGDMTGMEDGSDKSIEEMGARLLKSLNSNVLITRGEKGMSMFELDGNVTHIPTKAKEVYSIIGAGDTVVAVISLAIASGARFREAAILANIAAGIKVGKIGTATVSTDEIKKGIDSL